jgi:hypothetical protein
VAKRPTRKTGKRRLLEHRRRITASGSRRVEVTVPVEDVAAIRDLAAALRAGGNRAKSARAALTPVVQKPWFRSGAEFAEFFKNSPLADVELYLERDKSPGRPVDL